jgi:hypothetical protein
MKLLSCWVLVGLMLGVSIVHADRSSAEGLPLPWPFPWAKECPVDWTQMEGRYLLSENSQFDQIGLKIMEVNQDGSKLIRVSRFSANGDLLFDGFTLIKASQKTIHVHMTASHSTEPAVYAIIKLHYQSQQLQCAADQLVPILTLVKANTGGREKIQYKLVRVKGVSKL